MMVITLKHVGAFLMLLLLRHSLVHQLVIKLIKHYLFTAYKRHICLGIYLVYPGTTNGRSARFGMTLVTPLFSALPFHG